MTAIALAESGGEPTAVAQNDLEESIGLWQINLKAHSAMVEERGWDLSDPVDNARAAYEVSLGGRTINPWTVTHHRDGAEPKYLAHVAAAEAAATEAGHQGVLVNAVGSSGFSGTDVPAAADGLQAEPVVSQDPPDTVTPVDTDGQTPAPPVDPSAPDLDGRVGTFAEMGEAARNAVGNQDEGVPVGEFLRRALGQEGDRYVYGADPDPNDPDPDEFDCAELVQWSLEQLGAPNPGGSTNEQQLWLRDPANGAIEVPVDLAREIPGAVIYSVSSSRAADGRFAGHVAISLGNGETIEARGRDYGVGSWEMGDRFDTAFLLPGVDYTDLAGFDDTELDLRADGLRMAADNAGAADSDHDLLADHFEIRYGTDPAEPDMDGDGITDGYELMVLGTDAMNPDSDYDGLGDDIERVLGFDPTVFDNPDLSAEPTFVPEDWLDTDGDGIVDWAETMMGFDPEAADSDGDGIVDSMEQTLEPPPGGDDAVDLLDVDG